MKSEIEREMGVAKNRANLYGERYPEILKEVLSVVEEVEVWNRRVKEVIANIEAKSGTITDWEKQ
jgi:hypothetical protein